jgi:hypothetical protein
MINPVHAENLVKASLVASLLADDLRALAQSANPFLAETPIEMLKAATDLEQKLKRLDTATKTV